jgi:Rrf2 family protein
MHVSRKAEYACTAMMALAAHHGDPHPLRIQSIADAYGIKQPFLVQILLQLKGVGLVASTRGASGGYQLKRPPNEISLAHIIHAIDSAPTHEPGPAGPNEWRPPEAIRSVWNEIEAAEQKMLRAVTLDELVRRSQQGNDLSYQI